MRPHALKTAVLALCITSFALPGQAKTPTLAAADAGRGGDTLRDRGTHTRPHQFDIQLGLLYGYWLGLGVGGWYDIPVVPDGFIPGVNDSFDVEFGAILGIQPGIGYYNPVLGTTYRGVGLNLIPAGGVRWNFFLTPDWSLFASLKLAWNIYFLSGYVGGLTLPVTVGALYELSPKLHLRLEAGYPLGLSAGLSFDI